MDGLTTLSMVAGTLTTKTSPELTRRLGGFSDIRPLLVQRRIGVVVVARVCSRVLAIDDTPTLFLTRYISFPLPIPGYDIAGNHDHLSRDRPPLDLSHELSPHRLVALSHVLERRSHGWIRFTIDSAMSTDGTLDVSHSEHVLECRSLCHSRRLRGEHVHLTKACRELGDGIIVRPALEGQRRA